MNNGNTTRAKAIKALRKTNNDIVNAILEVSNWFNNNFLFYLLIFNN